jgi:hypothetical protein
VRSAKREGTVESRTDSYSSSTPFATMEAALLVALSPRAASAAGATLMESPRAASPTINTATSSPPFADAGGGETGSGLGGSGAASNSHSQLQSGQRSGQLLGQPGERRAGAVTMHAEALAVYESILSATAKPPQVHRAAGVDGFLRVSPRGDASSSRQAGPGGGSALPRAGASGRRRVGAPGVPHAHTGRLGLSRVAADTEGHSTGGNATSTEEALPRQLPPQSLASPAVERLPQPKRAFTSPEEVLEALEDAVARTDRQIALHGVGQLPQQATASDGSSAAGGPAAAATVAGTRAGAPKVPPLPLRGPAAPHPTPHLGLSGTRLGQRSRASRDSADGQVAAAEHELAQGLQSVHAALAALGFRPNDPAAAAAVGSPASAVAAMETAVRESTGASARFLGVYGGVGSAQRSDSDSRGSAGAEGATDRVALAHVEAGQALAALLAHLPPSQSRQVRESIAVAASSTAGRATGARGPRMHPAHEEEWEAEEDADGGHGGGVDSLIEDAPPIDALMAGAGYGMDIRTVNPLREGARSRGGRPAVAGRSGRDGVATGDASHSSSSSASSASGHLTAGLWGPGEAGLSQDLASALRRALRRARDAAEAAASSAQEAGVYETDGRNRDFLPRTPPPPPPERHRYHGDFGCPDPLQLTAAAAGGGDSDAENSVGGSLAEWERAHTRRDPQPVQRAQLRPQHGQQALAGELLAAASQQQLGSTPQLDDVHRNALAIALARSAAAAAAAGCGEESSHYEGDGFAGAGAALALSAEAHARINAAADSALRMPLPELDPILVQFAALPWPYNVNAIIAARQAAEEAAAQSDSDEETLHASGSAARPLALADAAGTRGGGVGPVVRFHPDAGAADASSPSPQSAAQASIAAAARASRRSRRATAAALAAATAAAAGLGAGGVQRWRDREGRFVRDHVYIPPLPASYAGYGGKGPLQDVGAAAPQSLQAPHGSGAGFAEDRAHATRAEASAGGQGSSESLQRSLPRAVAGAPAARARLLTTQATLARIAAEQAASGMHFSGALAGSDVPWRADSAGAEVGDGLYDGRMQHSYHHRDWQAGANAGTLRGAYIDADDAGSGEGAPPASAVEAEGTPEPDEDADVTASWHHGGGYPEDTVHRPAAEPHHSSDQAEESPQHNSARAGRSRWERAQAAQLAAAAAEAASGPVLWPSLPDVLQEAGDTVARMRAAGVLHEQTHDGSLHPPSHARYGTDVTLHHSTGAAPAGTGHLATAAGGARSRGVKGNPASPSGPASIGSDHVRALLERHVRQMEERQTAKAAERTAEAGRQHAMLAALQRERAQHQVAIMTAMGLDVGRLQLPHVRGHEDYSATASAAGWGSGYAYTAGSPHLHVLPAAGIDPSAVLDWQLRYLQEQPSDGSQAPWPLADSPAPSSSSGGAAAVPLSRWGPSPAQAAASSPRRGEPFTQVKSPASPRTPASCDGFAAGVRQEVGGAAGSGGCRGAAADTPAALEVSYRALGPASPLGSITGSPFQRSGPTTAAALRHATAPLTARYRIDPATGHGRIVAQPQSPLNPAEAAASLRAYTSATGLADGAGSVSHVIDGSLHQTRPANGVSPGSAFVREGSAGGSANGVLDLFASAASLHRTGPSHASTPVGAASSHAAAMEHSPEVKAALSSLQRLLS